MELVLRNARKAGLSHIITVGTDLGSSEKCIRLAEKYPMIFAAAGVHPHEASKTPANYLTEIEQFSEHEKVVAIGEIGLDYHYNFSDPSIQIKGFREQLELAQSVSLPVIVHNRESDDDLMESLKNSNCNSGVLHSFSGSLSFAQQVIDLNLYVGLSGMVTFIKHQIPEVVTWIPSDRYIIETDAPYLAPVPIRGRRNEPSYVTHVATKIAEIRDIPVEQVKDETLNNTLRLFSKISI